jgi:hypothetical protein
MSETDEELIAAHEAERKAYFGRNAKLAAEIAAKDSETAALRRAVLLVRSIIKDAAPEGFNPMVGNWAERLYRSQAVTSAALKGSPAPDPAEVMRAGCEERAVELWENLLHVKGRGEALSLIAAALKGDEEG